MHPLCKVPIMTSRAAILQAKFVVHLGNLLDDTPLATVLSLLQQAPRSHWSILNANPPLIYFTLPLIFRSVGPADFKKLCDHPPFVMRLTWNVRLNIAQLCLSIALCLVLIPSCGYL